MRFESFKNARIVRSAWLEKEGRRLDCGPYMSGALEAKDALDRLRVRKDPLRTLTTGHAGGIYNGPKFARYWVDDPKYGVPFLSSSDMMNADLSTLPFLKKSYAKSRQLAYLEVKRGTTLISCSGTIGRTVYVRPDMDGMWSSQHIMKVVPDESRIPPGYLYAFLSSKYGVPLIVSGTYGAIIQHIEPEHIAERPVPRLVSELETEVNNLIDKCATRRASAQSHIACAQLALEDAAGFSRHPVGAVTDFSTTAVHVGASTDRLDAAFYSAAAIRAEALLDSSRFSKCPLPKVVSRCFKPPIFRRRWVDSVEHGRMFVSGNDAYRYFPEESRFVSTRTPRFEEFILKRGWLAFQAAGQIYGLFGRPLYINGWLEDTFCADDVFRIIPHDEVDGAFLYLFFRTAVGQVLIKRQACGNSIPRVWEPHMSKVQVIWPDRRDREQFAEPVIAAHEMIEEARQQEIKAIELVERGIERMV